MWRVTVFDGFTASTMEFTSRSGYYSIADVFAILQANTDFKRKPPAIFMKRQSRRTTNKVRRKA